MADNIKVMDYDGAPQTLRTSEAGGVHTHVHNAQMRVGGADVAADNPVPVSLDALNGVAQALRLLAAPPWVDPGSGRLRVLIDPLGGAQTLAAVTTVSAVTNLSSIGGVAAASQILDAMQASWAVSVRSAIA